MSSFTRLTRLLLVSFWLVACRAVQEEATPEPIVAVTATSTTIVTPVTLPALLSVTPTLTPPPTKQPAPTARTTPVPTATTTAVPTVTPLPTAIPCRYSLGFVADITVPDDSRFIPDTQFTKVWRVQNDGTCAWPVGSSWVFVDGQQMSAPDVVAVPPIAPGETADIGVNFIAPSILGGYSSYWKLRLPDGTLIDKRCFTRISVVAPTPAPQPTVLPTLTPIPTLTPVPTSTRASQPIIHTFQANTAIADPGDTVEWRWTTSQATAVSLQRLLPSGQIGQIWDVNPDGNLTYTIPTSERNYITFVLVAKDDVARETRAAVSILLTCPDSWFFADAPNECPAGPPLISNAAEQRFEHGIMVWVEAQDLIYVLFYDSQSPAWWAYTDEWETGDAEFDPTLAPPNDYYQPIRGFGLVWREGFEVRERLGWAVEEEVGLVTAVQRTARLSHNDIYIRSQENDIWHLFPEGNRWEQMHSQVK